LTSSPPRLAVAASTPAARRRPGSTDDAITELGIAEDGGRVLTGPELDRHDDHALEAALSRVNVCARVTPAHKARVVLALRRAGHTVAMTGDGVNDAAAIRIADVGIALGGADPGAARRAADVVLVGDHVTRIVDSLLEGRALWVAVRDAVANLVGHNYRPNERVGVSPNGGLAASNGVGRRALPSSDGTRP
jgi:P-type E1-E2 ATPase